MALWRIMEDLYSSECVLSMLVLNCHSSVDFQDNHRLWHGWNRALCYACCRMLCAFLICCDASCSELVSIYIFSVFLTLTTSPYLTSCKTINVILSCESLTVVTDSNIPPMFFIVDPVMFIPAPTCVS